MSGGKQRLDQALVERGLAESRPRAKALILAGRVEMNGRIARKAGEWAQAEDEIRVTASGAEFVSRGGLKLEGFLQEYPLAIEGAVCADLGAATGGFTDCLLRHGARRVYALDVGYGQLHEKLRADPHVRQIERCNARLIQAGTFDDKLDLYTIDLSFISLAKVIPALLPAAGGGALDLIALIKPQFEAGRSAASRGAGVIRDRRIHAEVLSAVWSELESAGWTPLALDAACIKGPRGNREFLIAATSAARPRSAPFQPERAKDEWIERALGKDLEERRAHG